MPKKSVFRPRILYIAYWGAGEPLGRSVLNTVVRELANKGARITLLTFEHPGDRENTELMGKLAADFKKAGVRWLPLPYHHKPQAPATMYDLAQGALKVLSRRGWRNYDFVLGRTFVGGVLAGVLAPVLGAKLIFHNEGYYADERVDCGTWELGTRSYKVARRLEHWLYDQADGILCLSESSQQELLQRPKVQRKQTPVVFARTPVDVSRFEDQPDPQWRRGEPVRFLYAGTIGGPNAETQHGVANRYRLDEIGRFVARAREKGLDAQLQVLTIAPREVVAGVLEPTGLPREAWSSARATAEEIPVEYSRAHVGMHFMNPGLAAHAGSPTKVGEYFAAGLPVVVTPGIGDTAAIAVEDNVGVTVEGHEREQHLAALEQLITLLEDPTLAQRCREVGRRCQSLMANVEQQWGLLQHLSRRNA